MTETKANDFRAFGKTLGFYIIRSIGTPLIGYPQNGPMISYKTPLTICLVFLFPFFVFSDEEQSYPIYLYEIIGLLDESSAHASNIFDFPDEMPSGYDPFQSEDGAAVDTYSASFGTFWQSEYPSALRLHRILYKLRDSGIIKNDISITTDEAGRTQVASRSAKQVIQNWVVEREDSYLGWRLKDDFFNNASKEQWDTYFEAKYFRYGIEGYNVLLNPGAPIDRLIGYLHSECLSVVTVRTHTLIPNSTLLIFLPETDLSEKLNISSLCSLNVVDLAKESSDFPWSWEYRYDDYDKRYCISSHIKELGSLSASERATRLEYLGWIIRELQSGIRFYEKHESSISESRIKELSDLIKSIRIKIEKYSEPVDAVHDEAPR